MPRQKPKAAANTGQSPASSTAARVKKKYLKGFPRSQNSKLVRKALFEVQENGNDITSTAKKYGIGYHFLYRRVKGQVNIDSRNGPSPVLTLEEERCIASFISEMAMRGMGLGPSDIKDLVQKFLNQQKRNTPFQDNRPGYTWYYLFMARNKLVMKNEFALEATRSKVTPAKMDEWFYKYSQFMSDRNMLDQPDRVWNADESGFTMGSKAAKVIAPEMGRDPIPHLSGGSIKKRFTVMYCGNASGQLMPPFFVFPKKKPTGYDPLVGATRGAQAEYTEKGWMNAATFCKFIDHFDKYAGADRPVILTIDSVSSHLDMDTFKKAADKQIEIYRLLPNSTHLMQPLDKGVFGPLKKQWYRVVNKNTRENPGNPITMRNFALKLAEAQDGFYKPSTVANSFKATGIFPVDRTAIPNSLLKPSRTFEPWESPDEKEGTVKGITEDRRYSTPAREAFNVYRSVLSSPKQAKYEERLTEGCDIESPGFVVYKKLKEKAFMNTSTSSSGVENESPMSGLNLLATAAVTCGNGTSDPANAISPILQELTQFPKVRSVTSVAEKVKPVRLLGRLPDCLTSPEGIRQMALAKLKFAREKAQKEKRAKVRYCAKVERERKKAEKMPRKRMRMEHEDGTVCPVCYGNFEEESNQGISMIWVECGSCERWMHKNCIPINFHYNEDAFITESEIEFKCHICSK